MMYDVIHNRYYVAFMSSQASTAKAYGITYLHIHTIYIYIYIYIYTIYIQYIYTIYIYIYIQYIYNIYIQYMYTIYIYNKYIYTYKYILDLSINQSNHHRTTAYGLGMKVCYVKISGGTEHCVQGNPNS